MGGGDRGGPHAAASVAGSSPARVRLERARDLQKVKELYKYPRQRGGARKPTGTYPPSLAWAKLEHTSAVSGLLPYVQFHVPFFSS